MLWKDMTSEFLSFAGERGVTQTPAALKYGGIVMFRSLLVCKFVSPWSAKGPYQREDNPLPHASHRTRRGWDILAGHDNYESPEDCEDSVQCVPRWESVWPGALLPAASSIEQRDKWSIVGMGRLFIGMCRALCRGAAETDCGGLPLSAPVFILITHFSSMAVVESYFMAPFVSTS